MVYLDNAATTYPKPNSVVNAVSAAMVRTGANPGRGGYAMSQRTSDLVFDCRKELAEFFDAPGPECVVFTPNCTHGLNIVLKGLLKSGDHAVISSLEHNAVVRPLEKLKEKGISYSVATVCPGDNDKTVDAFRNALQKNTKLIVCTHASNVWGFRLPIERLAALAHAYGIPILVDCAQSAGILPIEMQKYGIDFICAPGHKGLYGPMGIGVMIALRGESLDTLTEGGTGTNSHELTMPPSLPERFESGTLNVPGIAGLLAGVRFVKRTGRENIQRHEMKLMDYLWRGLKNINEVTLYTERPTEKYFAPVLSFNLRDAASEEVAAVLARNQIAIRAGLHCAPLAHEFMGTMETGSVRAAPSFFTQQGDVDYLITCLWRNYKKFKKSG